MSFFQLNSGANKVFLKAQCTNIQYGFCLETFNGILNRKFQEVISGETNFMAREA